MTRRAMARRVAQLAGLTADQAARFLGVMPAIVVAELTASGKLHWRGLGSFAVRSYPPRKIHNPATGETIELPGRATITFKPSTQLRSKIKPRARPGPTSGKRRHDSRRSTSRARRAA